MEEFEEVPAPPTNQGAAAGKFSFGEIFDYIIRRRYPEGISKSDKNVLRKRVKFSGWTTRICTTLAEVYTYV